MHVSDRHHSRNKDPTYEPPLAGGIVGRPRVDDPHDACRSEVRCRLKGRADAARQRGARGCSSDGPAAGSNSGTRDASTREHHAQVRRESAPTAAHRRTSYARTSRLSAKLHRTEGESQPQDSRPVIEAEPHQTPRSPELMGHPVRASRRKASSDGCGAIRASRRRRSRASSDQEPGPTTSRKIEVRIWA